MKLIRVRDVLHLNARNNIIINMELCNSLGIYHGSMKCLVLYTNHNTFEDIKDGKEEGIFLHF